MLKLYVIFVLLSTGCACIGAQRVKREEHFDLPPTDKDLHNQHEEDCIKKTGVHPDVVRLANMGQFTHDEALKKYTLCFFQKSGILSQDVKFNTDAALFILPDDVDKIALAKKLETCKKKSGKTHADIAFKIYKCYLNAINVVLKNLSEDFELSPTQIDLIDQYEEDCIKKTGVNPEVVRLANQGYFTHDEALKKYTLCFFQKSGILSQGAQLNTDAVLSILPAYVDKIALVRMLEKCKKKGKTGKTHADTAFKIYKCYVNAVNVALYSVMHNSN